MAEIKIGTIVKVGNCSYIAIEEMQGELEGCEGCSAYPEEEEDLCIKLGSCDDVIYIRYPLSTILKKL